MIVRARACLMRFSAVAKPELDHTSSHQSGGGPDPVYVSISELANAPRFARRASEAANSSAFPCSQW
ncbi:hypothetical protein CH63R_12891 [Colletotrichum higginsianum IMI 349063]|uniref:Uncharacterized protein n=1 Tax=Colletotrichum higginsianum (strain IMI 349063) TaxID=759273 RepID=A0A1B7XVJ2_COLHI|nr:hypothetical protein CH63R_12891 [Colletotrichum higginsianum IMI 349063]OBR03764.1 hypothetical protein CH63R_12891 [Colletotrichum higginsianum IMI 349063]